MRVKKIVIRNRDGSKNQLQLYGANHKEQTIILMLPAMAVKASYYARFAVELAQYCKVATLDLRGHGASSVRASSTVDYGYADFIEHDLHTTISNLRLKFPKHKLFILGHSLGGQLGALYAAKRPTLVDGLILVASGSVYYKGWKGMQQLRTLVGTQATGVISNIFGFYPGKLFGFGGLDAKSLMLDWSNQARTGKYELLHDEFDYEYALGKLKIDTLAISFQNDEFAPEQAVENLYLKFNPTSAIDHRHLMNDHPLNETFNHYSWTKSPKNIITIIRDWFSKL